MKRVSNRRKAHSVSASPATRNAAKGNRRRRPVNANRHASHACRGRKTATQLKKAKPLRRRAGNPYRRWLDERKRVERAAEQLRAAGHKFRMTYDGPPANERERDRRESEQYSIAGYNGKDWDKLSRWEKERRIRFGSEAWCKTPNDVRDLLLINSHICREKEKQAVSTWQMNRSQRRALRSLVGFAACDELVASNKKMRTQMGYRLARSMKRQFRKSHHHFYFITLISRRWNTRHGNTHIKLREIRRTVEHLMRSLGLHWIAALEFDFANNFPKDGNGLAVMPNVHMIAWSKESRRPIEIQSALSSERLLSKPFGRPTVVVKNVRHMPDLMHLCYYLSKPNFSVKSFRVPKGSANPTHIYVKEYGIRPSQILRISEIQSHLTIDDVLFGNTIGRLVIKHLLVKMRHWQERTRQKAPKIDDVGEFWDQIRPPRSRKAYQRITFDSPLTGQDGSAAERVRTATRESK